MSKVIIQSIHLKTTKNVRDGFLVNSTQNTVMQCLYLKYKQNSTVTHIGLPN